MIGPPGHPALLWAALAGLEAWASAPGAPPVRADLSAWTARLRWRDPWTGAEIGAEAGLAAAEALLLAAEANAWPVVTAGFTPWKRRCAAPFLEGPCGPPRHRRDPEAAARLAARIGGRVAVWGMRPGPGASGKGGEGPGAAGHASPLPRGDADHGGGGAPLPDVLTDREPGARAQQGLGEAAGAGRGRFGESAGGPAPDSAAPDSAASDSAAAAPPDARPDGTAEAPSSTRQVAGPRPGARAPAPPVLRLEDGFLRSVGLGLRHAPPASLCIAAHGLHFDATRRGDLERIALSHPFPPALLRRAAALRARLVALGLTKYNLSGGGPPLPDTGRSRLLVAGQVEDDASIRFGAPGIRTNAALLRAERARRPDAFLLWRPHPDVRTGLRPGAVDAATLAECADAVAAEASTEACLDWAEEVGCITSQIGFEALLRGRRVAVHGRPFYAGWGLTEELSAPDPARAGPAGAAPFFRGRRLSLDALTAAALILHPRCIDPATRLPCTPERLLDALEAERAAAGTLRGRLRKAARDASSWALNRLR